MSGNDFDTLAQIVAFVAVIWIMGRLCRLFNVSPIIGEISAGIIMGPQVADIVPGVKRKHGVWESLWQVAGTIGVTLMIAESGTHIHFDKLRQVGVSALIVAIVGTFLPLVCGLAVAKLLFNENFESSFAAGTALAPTSVGIALKLLSEKKQLNSNAGQTIVSAAFIDDVFSIILLVVLESVGKGNIKAETIILQFIWCFLFLGVGTFLSLYFWKKALPYMLNKIELYRELNYQPRDEVHLFIMLLILCGYSYIGDLIGSHLLGAFIAGMSFSQVPRSMYVWRRQMKRIASWLIRFFFAATVAFSIPVSQLFSAEAFGWGLLFAVGPTLLGKVLAGFFARKPDNDTTGITKLNLKLMVGFAMVGRGEFAYLVAQTAKGDLDMMSDKMYAKVVWALLLAVICAPIAFNKILTIAFSNIPGSGVKYFIIQAEGHHHNGIHFEIVDVLHNLNLDILEAKVETDGDVDASEFIVAVGGGDELDEDKIHEIQHDLKEAVADPLAQIQMLPVQQDQIPTLLQEITSEQQNGSVRGTLRNLFGGHSNNRNICINKNISMDKNKYLEIKLMASHCPNLFPLITMSLSHLGFSLVKAYMEDFTNTDHEVLFFKPTYDKQIRINIRDIKRRIMDLLITSNITGEVLARVVSKDHARIPKHVKFSDLLKHGNFNSNPLLKSSSHMKLPGFDHSNRVDSVNTIGSQRNDSSDTILSNNTIHSINGNNSNNIINKKIRDFSCDQCGYEIDIKCEEKQNLLTLLYGVIEPLKLDIRALDIEMANRRAKAHFFVQEKNEGTFSPGRRRRAIERKLTQVFQYKNMMAEIKIKAIEMGKENITTPQRGEQNEGILGLDDIDNLNVISLEALDPYEGEDFTGINISQINNIDYENKYNIDNDIGGMINSPELELMDLHRHNSVPVNSAKITESTVKITPIKLSHFKNDNTKPIINRGKTRTTGIVILENQQSEENINNKSKKSKENIIYSLDDLEKQRNNNNNIFRKKNQNVNNRNRIDSKTHLLTPDTQYNNNFNQMIDTRNNNNSSNNNNNIIINTTNNNNNNNSSNNNNTLKPPNLSPNKHILVVDMTNNPNMISRTPTPDHSNKLHSSDKNSRDSDSYNTNNNNNENEILLTHNV